MGDDPVAVPRLAVEEAVEGIPHVPGRRPGVAVVPARPGGVEGPPTRADERPDQELDDRLTEEERKLPFQLRPQILDDDEIETLRRMANDPEYNARVKAMLDRIRSQPRIKERKNPCKLS